MPISSRLESLREGAWQKREEEVPNGQSSNSFQTINAVEEMWSEPESDQHIGHWALGR